MIDAISENIITEPSMVLSFTESTDKTLAGKAAEGCQRSFSVLVDRYSPRIVGFIYGRCGKIQDAEDIAQDAFIKAWQNIQRYDNRYEFSTWIFTIAIRLTSNYYRNQRMILNDEILEQLPAKANEGPEIALDQKEQKDQLWQLAGKLSAIQYNILYLHYAQQMSIKQISQTIGKTKVAVKVNLFRARKNLQKLLEQ
ncbi:MAG: sigma-70 family RNA polymerase sigma factor [Phycisphaerae bacterium]|nr:sigma-70 family RNA polymerase sigma factor [Phycisphaerae bacterium]